MQLRARSIDWRTFEKAGRKRLTMLDPQTIERLLSVALARGGDYADIFCERRRSSAFRLQDGRIHEAAIGVSQGVGVRVIVGESAGYAYSDDLSVSALERAAKMASLIAHDRNTGHHTVALTQQHVTSLYDPNRNTHAHSSEYVSLLERADSTARAFDPRIVAVNASVIDELQDVWIAASDGRLVHDHRPLVTLGVQVVSKSGEDRGTGYIGDGSRTSIGYYRDRTPESIATEAARIAMTNLEAVPAPAGEMEMVVGAGGGGVLLHEAVGHGLESDFNRQGVSLYSGRIGERVASELVTIFDDGNLPDERGSLSVDDEGTPGSHNVLVERGILRGYMQDHLNARLMGVAPNGHGRRQSFRVMPQPRMCNTYMPSGQSDVDEIIRSTKRGIYAKSFAGGQVEISRGDFVFMVAEGYLIEDGKITSPVRNATIVGNGPEVMTRVTAVAADGKLANRHYTCGKGGQYVPVGVGMPTVKISSITVGGSNVG
ncbi:MAG: metallopeptidase TldD-related protein [Candidatus Eremiobacteraeota bacterium]|nr:metallopeptidase TldD-related protein [Candidatus Eremiobacteraeota bacterium]